MIVPNNINSMKKLIIALICSILPIYKYFTWILICIQPTYKTHKERVKAYHEIYGFDLAINELYMTLFAAFLGLLSIFFLIKAEIDTKYVILKNIFLAILGAVTFLHIWTLL